LEAYFLDSNLFFYAKIQDREYGQPCGDILRKVEEGRLKAITSVLAILEFANALRKYGLGNEVKQVVDAAFSMDIEIHDIDPYDVRSAMNIFDEFRISPYDCIHAAIMKRTGTRSMISADKDFDKITWIKRLDPKKANLSV